MLSLLSSEDPERRRRRRRIPKSQTHPDPRPSLSRRVLHPLAVSSRTGVPGQLAGRGGIGWGASPNPRKHPKPQIRTIIGAITHPNPVNWSQQSKKPKPTQNRPTQGLDRRSRPKSRPPNILRKSAGGGSRTRTLKIYDQSRCPPNSSVPPAISAAPSPYPATNPSPTATPCSPASPKAQPTSSTSPPEPTLTPPSPASPSSAQS